MNMNMHMKTKSGRLGHKGFTLIELIITIVIIGVLAAVAIPKFQSLTSDAQKGVAAGVGAALASATSVNYARSVVPNPTACTGALTIGAGTCTYYALTTCTALNAAKSDLADIPSGYTIAPGTALVVGQATGTCDVQDAGGNVLSTFKAYGA